MRLGWCECHKIHTSTTIRSRCQTQTEWTVDTQVNETWRNSFKAHLYFLSPAPLPHNSKIHVTGQNWTTGLMSDWVYSAWLQIHTSCMRKPAPLLFTCTFNFWFKRVFPYRCCQVLTQVVRSLGILCTVVVFNMKGPEATVAVVWCYMHA